MAHCKIATTWTCFHVYVLLFFSLALPLTVIWSPFVNVQKRVPTLFPSFHLCPYVTVLCAATFTFLFFLSHSPSLSFPSPIFRTLFWIPIWCESIYAARTCICGFVEWCGSRVYSIFYLKHIPARNTFIWINLDNKKIYHIRYKLFVIGEILSTICGAPHTHTQTQTQYTISLYEHS